MTLLAVFRSRAQALDCISSLKAAGVPAQAVSNPKEAGVGCGISAMFDERFLSRAMTILNRRRYSAYKGIMKKRGSVYSYE